MLVFHSHYDIQEKGFVQEIHYVSENEMGSLRLVNYSTEEEPQRCDSQQQFFQMAFSLWSYRWQGLVSLCTCVNVEITMVHLFLF